MRIEELWRQLEEEASGTSGWSTRFARPGRGLPLLVALDRATRTRAVLVRASNASIPSRSDWPDCRGIEILKVLVGSDTYLAVRLRDVASQDVFSALAELLAARVALADSESAAIAELLGGLRRWQVFLAAAREGLGIESQRGLFGELYFLDRVLVPALGPRVAVQGWKGFAGAHQDFQFGTAAIEVKTTSAAVPEMVRITSERQLDDTGAGELFLHVVVVDEREVTPIAGVAGETLAGLVAKCRASLASDPVGLSMLDEGLLQIGWLDAHAGRYDVRRLTVRSQLSLHVRDGFPRLLARSLPAGVADVTYALNLAACRAFEVPTDTVLTVLGRTGAPHSAAI